MADLKLNPDKNSIEWWILAGLVALLFVGMIYIMASYKPVVNVQCKPSWSCSDFGSCVNGMKTRTCVDSSGCANMTNMPYLTDSCSNQTINNTNTTIPPVCTENWVCSVWYPCSILGVQKRNCEDSNHCGTNKAAPDTERTCTVDFNTNAIGGKYNTAGTWIVVNGYKYTYYGSSSYHCIPADIMMRTPQDNPICSRAGYDPITERLYLEYSGSGVIFKRSV